MANEFNQFFSNVGQNANKSIQSLIFKADDFNPTEFVPLNNSISEQFHFRTVTANEVQAILMSIPSNKSAGHEKIPIKVYKDCLSSILPSITVYLRFFHQLLVILFIDKIIIVMYFITCNSAERLQAVYI